MRLILTLVFGLAISSPALADCKSWMINCNGTTLSGGTEDGYGNNWNQTLGGGYRSSNGQTWQQNNLDNGWTRSDGLKLQSAPFLGNSTDGGQNCRQTLSGQYSCN